jgi:hypothetical protein
LIQVTTGCTISGDLTGNLTGVDPLLTSAGPFDPYALQAGSPAIDSGDNANCPATDQRGVTRPQRTGCDIGAFELE